MQITNFVAALFIALMLMMVAIYTSRRNTSRTHMQLKQLNDDSEESEPTESEPELEIKEKEVDKMDKIPEENEIINLNNNDELKSDISTDSEEYSMQKMVEEYNKSRTLAKKISEIIEDISDTFKRKSIEIKKKFEPEPKPAVIRPMSMTEKLAQINVQKNHHQSNNNKGNKGSKHIKKKKRDKKVKVKVIIEKQPIIDDDEKQPIIEKDIHDENGYMVDSEEEFADFNANFEEIRDFESDKVENDNDAVEIINMDKKVVKNEKYKHEPIEVVVEDEKVNETVKELQQLLNEEQVSVADK